MSTPFYTIRYTDPTKATFVVTPSTTDGPLNPNTAALGPAAVSAHTTLEILGRGWFDYGQPVAQSLVYMLENFANDIAPTYPIEGQLWYNNTTGQISVYNGSVWSQLQLTITGNLDANGFRLVNLADPIAATDGLNLQYADTRYLQLSGGVLTGNLVVVNLTTSGTSAFTGDASFAGNVVLSGAGSELTLPNAPVATTDATNKAYVDTAIAVGVAAGISTIGASYVAKAGDTMTGVLSITTGGGLDVEGPATFGTLGGVTFTGAANLNGLTTINNSVNVHSTVTFSTLSSLKFGGGLLIDMGGNLVTNVAAPSLSTDAANKAYVDAAVGGGSGGGSPITGADFDSATGTLSIHQAALPDVIVNGEMAPFIHTQPDSTVTVNVDPTYFDSFLRQQNSGNAAYPTVPHDQAYADLDRAVFQLTRTRGRQVQIATGGPQLIAMEDTYVVGSNRLEVYLDGIKQVAALFARGRVKMVGNVDVSTDSGLTTSTSYAFNLTVNGTSYPNVSITTPATGPVSLYAVVNLLAASLLAASIPAIVQFARENIVFYSITCGAGSSVAVSAPTAGTDLFATMANVLGITNETITADYSYKESGSLLDVVNQSSSFTFNAPGPVAGQIIEVITAQA